MNYLSTILIAVLPGNEGLEAHNWMSVWCGVGKSSVFVLVCVWDD